MNKSREFVNMSGCMYAIYKEETVNEVLANKVVYAPAISGI